MPDDENPLESEVTPLRAALVRFFKTLLANSEKPHSVAGSETIPADQAVREAAASYEVVAEQYWDACRTRSDAMYARFIHALEYVSVEQLCKLCEGFRVVQLDDAYYQLNAAHVEPGAGLRALCYGCTLRIIPVALSYRHAPHEFTMKSDSNASETTSGSNILATVDISTAERFVQLQRSDANRAEASHKDAKVDGVAIVWIDRAVKGLSVDGDWFVRGLLPYCLVPVVGGYRSKEDFERPWIWLEFRFSTRAYSSGQLQALIDIQEPLFIALQALYLPSRILAEYEYREEMEAVILDMFAFGVSMFGPIPSEAGSRQDAVAQWNDLKVGMALAFACIASVGISTLDMRTGLLRLDERNPYGCDVFREGLLHVLRSAGVEVEGGAAFTAYKFVDGSMAVTRRMGDTTAVMTRVPDHAMSSLKSLSDGQTIRRYLCCEMRNLKHRYELLGLEGDDMYDTADELSVLASCRVVLKRVEESERRRAMDDADATVGQSMAIKSGILEEHRELSVQFDGEKAELNAERSRRYSLGKWIDRVRARDVGFREKVDQALSKTPSNDFVAEGSAGIKEEVQMWFDYNRGTLRWTTQAVDGDVIFRRIKFDPDVHRLSMALRCRRRDVPQMTKALLSFCVQDNKFGWAAAEVTERLRLAFQDPKDTGD